MEDDSSPSVLHKHPKTRGYVQIENTSARDPRLTFKASGLLVHLLSLPQGSKIGSVELAKARPKMGRVAIQTAYRELRENGYVTQERKQTEGGQWITTTHVYEVPPDAGNLPSVPDADSPTSVNLPVSLRDKDEPIEEQEQVLRTCCGENFTSLELYQDHLETCIEANDWTPASKLKLL